MREILKKISSVMKKIFGWGMLISLSLGAIMFFGYIVALIIGGDIAAAICYFLYKQLAPVLIYATSILVLFGLVAMYLGGEAALSGKKKDKPKADTEPSTQNGSEVSRPEAYTESTDNGANTADANGVTDQSNN